MTLGEILLAVWLGAIVIYAVVGVLLLDDATTHALIAAVLMIGTRAALALLRRVEAMKRR